MIQRLFTEFFILRIWCFLEMFKWPRLRPTWLFQAFFWMAFSYVTIAKFLQAILTNTFCSMWSLGCQLSSQKYSAHDFAKASEVCILPFLCVFISGSSWTFIRLNLKIDTIFGALFITPIIMLVRPVNLWSFS